jgi:Holliday junction resolvase RusA-like endonuclease
MLQVELPFPPSVNHYYRHVGPRTLISREGRAFREKVCAILALRGVRRMSGPLTVTIQVHPPDNRRRDLDNTQKALLDALQHGGAYDDDSQIVRLISEKAERVPGGCVVVRIEEVG